MADDIVAYGKPTVMAAASTAATTMQKPQENKLVAGTGIDIETLLKDTLNSMDYSSIKKEVITFNDSSKEKVLSAPSQQAKYVIPSWLLQHILLAYQGVKTAPIANLAQDICDESQIILMDDYKEQSHVDLIAKHIALIVSMRG